MMASLEIKVQIKWEKEQPDQDACYCCGESIFLELWRAYIRINREPWRAQNIRVCQSCYNALAVSKDGR